MRPLLEAGAAGEVLLRGSRPALPRRGRRQALREQGDVLIHPLLQETCPQRDAAGEPWQLCCRGCISLSLCLVKIR